MSYKVWLDAGHGGADSGAVSNGLVEKALNYATTAECKLELERHGIVVGLTRTNDSSVDLSKRCSLANSWKADYFVSIHHNAGVKGGKGGAEAIHSIHGGKGLNLAKQIVESIEANTDQTLRPKPIFSRASSSGKDYFAVIRDTNMPAVIVECAFLDGQDKITVDTAQEQKLMGRAIAIGILKFIGITYQQVPSTDNTPTTMFKVAVGAFSRKDLAIQLEKELKSKGISDAYILYLTDRELYRVNAGAFKDRQNANARLEQLKKLGYSSAYLVIE